MSKLLIVDDESDIREFAKSFFKKRGIEVLTASGGRQAIELIMKETPDLVLLDVRMEEMTGIETLRELRKANNNTRVIMVTVLKKKNHQRSKCFRCVDIYPQAIDPRRTRKDCPRSMSVKIDYKKELESAAKGMILIHDPKLLIKLIVRSIVQKVQIDHAGMILYDPVKDSYVLSIFPWRSRC